jgi:low affinity Fe/Cu permease
MKFRKEHRDTHTTAVERPARVRGGVSIGAVLTGVVVGFGSMFLLSALVGGILAATGVDTTEEIADGARQATVGAAVSLVVAMFLAYSWGGYTAGRMGRGAGALNGFLVPLLALLVGAIVVTVVTALGATANLNLPFGDSQLPIEGENLIEFGTGIAIASLIAMFLGGIIGGMMGARWHTKLERRVISERESERDEKLAIEERRRAELRRQEEARTEEARTADARPTEPRPTERRTETRTETRA